MLLDSCGIRTMTWVRNLWTFECKLTCSRLNLLHAAQPMLFEQTATDNLTGASEEVVRAVFKMRTLTTSAVHVNLLMLRSL